MSATATDRQRVELLVVVGMLTSVVLDGARDLRERETHEAARLLSEASNAILAGCTVEDRIKLCRRRDNIDGLVLRRHRSLGKPVAAFGLAVFALLRQVTDDGYLVIGPDSALMAALDRILPALAKAAERDALSLVAARATARTMIEDLQERGYFLAVPTDGGFLDNEGEEPDRDG